MDEEFDDNCLLALEPEEQIFWNIVPKIICKTGPQLKFMNALKELKSTMKKDFNNPNQIEDYKQEYIPENYKIFNPYEVS